MGVRRPRGLIPGPVGVVRRLPRRVLFVLAVVAAIPVPVAAHLPPLPSLRHSDSLAAADLRMNGEDGTLTLTERSYRLALDPHTGRVTVATLDGREYTGFPLAMSRGATLPKGVHRVRPRPRGRPPRGAGGGGHPRRSRVPRLPAGDERRRPAPQGRPPRQPPLRRDLR